MSLIVENLKKTMGDDYERRAPRIYEEIFNAFPVLSRRIHSLIISSLDDIAQELCKFTGSPKLLICKNCGLLQQYLSKDLYQIATENIRTTPALCSKYTSIQNTFRSYHEMRWTNKTDDYFKKQYTHDMQVLLTTDRDSIAMTLDSTKITHRSVQPINEFICFEILPYILKCIETEEMIVGIYNGYDVVPPTELSVFSVLKSTYQKVKTDKSREMMICVKNLYSLIMDTMRLHGINLSHGDNIFDALFGVVTEGEIQKYIASVPSNYSPDPEKTERLIDRLLNSIDSIDNPSDVNIQESSDISNIPRKSVGSDESVSGLINKTGYIGNDLVDNDEEFNKIMLLASEMTEDKVREYVNARLSMPVSLKIPSNSIGSFYTLYPDIKKIQMVNIDRGPITIINHDGMIGILFVSRDPEDNIYMIELENHNGERHLAKFSIKSSGYECKIDSEFTTPAEDGGAV